jgi:hypothetical protein
VHRAERIGLAILLALFTWFTWRGLTMFFSGDDMMNMYGAWLLNPWRLGRSLIEIWLPVYRPLGGAVYRLFFAAFGFHPLPLYIFCWLILAANVILAWRFLRAVSSAAFEALTALSIVLVHGSFQDLYISAGTIYDRLCFLFTVLALGLYRRLVETRKGQALLCLLCILCMDSKESGIALPVLLGLYELIFVLPGTAFKQRLKKLAPLYGVLALICLLFVYLRVHRTPELNLNAAYAPHASLTLWLTRLSDYLTILAYSHIAFSKVLAAIVLGAMAAIAAALRNRPMIFGWLFFVVTITPVALISSRPGYVLYVPDLGLGIWLAALLWRIGASRAPAVAFAAVTALVLWFHLSNWPPPINPTDSPEYRLTEQFRRDYPTLPQGAKLLFVSDAFPKPAFDLLFNLRMMYRDRTIRADRLEAPPDQQPDPKHPLTYDHVFVNESGHYLELDNANPAESRRLHILKDFTVGREMDISRKDHAAYVISGLMDGDNPDPSRWTEPDAKFKFDLYPAPALFHAKFWVPDFVAKSAKRTLHILVNDKEVAAYPLTQDGMNEVSFPVPAAAITRNGFTIVEMKVENPYREFGVVLLNAGFTYATSEAQPIL